MPDARSLILLWLRRARRRGRTLILLFDYDGTLTPIVEHPDLATLPPATRCLLAALAARPGVRLGVISGRALADLKQMVPLGGIELAGSSGLEMELSGQIRRHPEAETLAARLAEIHRELQQVVAPYRGAWVEAKPVALTVHFRQVAQEELGEVEARARAALERLGADLHVSPGPMALEIVPQLGWTKGTAVRMMIEHAGAEAAAPCYFGDHANDAAAFDAVAALGGIAVGIGDSAPESARFRLPSPEALQGLLAELLEALERDSGDF